MFIDSHSHDNLVKDIKSKLPSIINNMQKANVIAVVENGIDIKTSDEVLNLAEQFPKQIFPAVGIQPEVFIPGMETYDPNFAIDEEIKKLESLIKGNREKIVAVGECGLDYYQEVKNKEKQVVLFKKQLELAKKYNLPVVVHSRGAEQETFSNIQRFKDTEIQRRESFSVERKASSDKRNYGKLSNDTMIKLYNGEDSFNNVLFHSYTGPLLVLKEVLEKGAYVSFNGILTFKNGENVRDLFEFAWNNYPNQILAETDSPLLAPAGKRGEVNEPANVAIIVKHMALLAGSSETLMENKIYENSVKFFNL